MLYHSMSILLFIEIPPIAHGIKFEMTNPTILTKHINYQYSNIYTNTYQIYPNTSGIQVSKHPVILSFTSKYPSIL